MEICGIHAAAWEREHAVHLEKVRTTDGRTPEEVYAAIEGRSVQ